MVAVQVCIAMDSWIKTASIYSIQKTGLKMAVVVGAILNLINQGDILFAANWQHVHLPKLPLTFCVPYCVAIYTGTASRRSA